jgi:hypothetical protein
MMEQSMANRRQLIARLLKSLSVIWAGLSFPHEVFGREVSDPESAREKAALAGVWGEDCSFVADVQSRLRQAVDEGLLQFDVRKTVLCPLCQQHVQISLTDTKRVQV